MASSETCPCQTNMRISDWQSQIIQNQTNVCPYAFAKIKRPLEENQSLSVPQTCEKGKHGLEQEEERLRSEQEEQFKRLREEDGIAREQRLLSGADCGWTQLQRSPHWFCRTNGRTYRASPTKDQVWNLYRVHSTSDDEKGALIANYQETRRRHESD